MSVFKNEISATKWRKLIPACAVQIKEEADAYLYLHPTRGWKRVSKRRLKGS